MTAQGGAPGTGSKEPDQVVDELVGLLPVDRGHEGEPNQGEDPGMWGDVTTDKTFVFLF